MSSTNDDSYYMGLALEEAARSLEEDHIPVGAVIVCDGEVVARGRNEVNRLESVFAHAEMQAMSEIEQFLYNNKGRCTLYTTLEPCMMCLGAIVYNEIARLVVAMRAPGVGGIKMLDAVEHYRKNAPEIEIGFMEQESRELIRKYVAKTGLRADLLED